MSQREERVAHNEDISREINEGIERGHDGATRTDQVRMVCECGHEDCDRLIAISIEEYERVRSDPHRFVVVHAHVVEDTEEIVSETTRFVVVEKRGEAGEVAEEEDPRS
jgi:hypothetical protein